MNKRLKKYFLEEGLDNFSEYQVLELLLFYIIPRKDTNEIAHRLIDHFGSLAQVLDSPIEQLEKVESQRKLRRERRRKDGIPTVALVGYTNAGKSTLLNYLTDAGVLAEDKLFATLDPTARALRLPDGREVMLVDTVGFVRRLPHQLVRAFHSTLEEAVDADVILNICDASSPHAAEHLQVTGDLLAELGCGDTPVLQVMNSAKKITKNYCYQPANPL